MIELNLLPDVKMEYIKAQRTRRLVFSIAILVSLASIVLLALLLSVDGLQKKHLSDLNRDITTESSTLKSKPQINQVLTVQNQLQSLTALHASKPAASRLFSYLNEVTPASVSISSLNIDFTQYTVNLTGNADALKSINQFVDTLKSTTYTTTTSKTPAPAFSNVVLSSFSISGSSASSSASAASYTIALSYNKNLFDITQTPTLTVPSLTTTRIGQAQPSSLFTASTPSSGSTGSATNSGGQ